MLTVIEASILSGYHPVHLRRLLRGAVAGERTWGPGRAVAPPHRR